MHSSKPRFSVEFVDRYYVKLGVEELGVGEWDEIESFMKLGVEELGVGELAGAGAFQDALQ